MAGLVTPLVAAFAMSSSSLIVIANALRLGLSLSDQKARAAAASKGSAGFDVATGESRMSGLIFLIPLALLLGAIGLSLSYGTSRRVSTTTSTVRLGEFSMMTRMVRMHNAFCKLVAAAVVELICQTYVASAASDSARRDFLELCADCHNPDAKGNGPLTKNLTKIPPDLTRIRARAHGVFDEKAVYDWILGLKMTKAHGTREMPIWGDWLMDEAVEGDTSLEAAAAAEKEVAQRVMAIVKYLETIQVEP